MTLTFLDKLREVEVSSATSHYSFLPICKDDPRNFCANIDLALKICASSLSENSDGKSHDMTGCDHKFGTDLARFSKLRKVFEQSEIRLWQTEHIFASCHKEMLTFVQVSLCSL